MIVMENYKRISQEGNLQKLPLPIVNAFTAIGSVNGISARILHNNNALSDKIPAVCFQSGTALVLSSNENISSIANTEFVEQNLVCSGNIIRKVNGTYNFFPFNIENISDKFLVQLEVSEDGKDTRKIILR